MNRPSQRGVALVITLLMLSVVTFMAVVFLSMSRRERLAVTIVADHTDARLMADAALARAQSEVVARILATTNSYSYDFMSSTNFISPAGFRVGVVSPTNVSYFYPNQQPLNAGPAGLNDWLLNLANMQYDARPPVFIPTNDLGALDFRFFVDFNRNRRYEPTGLLNEADRGSGRTNTVFAVGDAEWIGVLERPDRPHSESNRFVGRYAFYVLPAGKSLDLNFIHNNARFANFDVNQDGFNRNQGIGSWELNLAAFLRDLNTNIWLTYNYTPSLAAPNVGTSFNDAHLILSHRYFNPVTQNRRLDPAGAVLGAAAVNAFRTDGIDGYSDGPLLVGSANIWSVDMDQLPPGDDAVNKSWSGSPNPQAYYDVQAVYRTNETSLQFVARMTAMTNSIAAYDRYTFYRLLAQMGMDSRPADSNKLFQADFQLWPTNKLHLNYRNEVRNGQTNFVPWDPVILGNPQLAASNPVDFFMTAADRLLRSGMATNVNTNRVGLALSTNFIVGVTPVRSGFSVTNIQIFNSTLNAPYYTTNNEYSASVHRLLQVAANLYDSTTRRSLGTTNDYPSVFRPIFGKGLSGTAVTNVYIAGFVEVTNGPIELGKPMRNLRIPADRAALRFDDNVAGIPWVIGVKKGYPNFNEFSVENAIQVSRKLEVRRSAATRFHTNQMYVLGVSNVFGLEAWNSYTQDFRRPVELRVNAQFDVALTNVVNNVAGRLRLLSGSAAVTMTNLVWTNSTSLRSFILPVHTNFIFLTNAAYLASRGQPFLFDPRNTNSFENSFDPPQWLLYITNRLQYALLDRSVTPARVVDFVNLDNMVTVVDIAPRLAGDLEGGGSMFGDRNIRESDIWRTNRTSLTAPTLGIQNQISVALGDPRVAQDVWRSHIEDPIAGADKAKAIEKFQEFFRANSTNISMQVPYTPTRKIYVRNTWQANDPIVHYMLDDLSDPILTDPNSTNNVMWIRPPNNPLPVGNLGQMNERYRPWGGNPNKSTDETNYKVSLKDPGVRRSDDWQFPTNKFPNIGWIGRVHRGTPWQTVYLKSTPEDPRVWLRWSGNLGTQPTNDWKIADLFTVAPNSSAARGLLSVNQTNIASWSAVLSGVSVQSNSLPLPGPLTTPVFRDLVIDPSSPQLTRIVAGITRTRAQQRSRVFNYLGDVLATPELTVASPFLNLSSTRQLENGINDIAMERIPQQILSLLKADEPRVVVYAFGQSLKPAERSLVTSGNFYNICTNYQITGEVFSKALLRIDDAGNRPRVVVESYNVLSPE
jgi:hypothetical protein